MTIGLQAMKQPLIGILTMEDAQQEFRGNHDNFIDIIRAGKALGLEIIVITPRDLRLDRTRIYGYHYDLHEKTWKRQVSLIPSVIYNRIPQREDELLPEVQQLIRACIRHPRIQLFNPAFFNKWTLFEWLRKSKTTKRYIPYTRKLTPKLAFSKLLHQYKQLYLKPEKGKAGKGIMRLRLLNNKAAPYRLSIQANKHIQNFQYKSISKLKERIYTTIGDEPYIVQQGIGLASYQQRPFDLRILAQKNRLGRWSISGIGARIAGSLSITTHVPRGGTIDEPQKLLSASFGVLKARKMISEVRKTALAISRQIERGSGHSLGEMSLDLGVDTSGQIWFFEANAKPMKFDEPDIRRKSLNQLLQYCMYLSRVHKVPKKRKNTR